MLTAPPFLWLKDCPYFNLYHFLTIAVNRFSIFCENIHSEIMRKTPRSNTREVIKKGEDMIDPIIMITGTHGFVGARAMQRYPDAIPVPSELVQAAGEPLTDFIKAHNPDIIVNAAAISDIGACERDPDASYAANVRLPVLLAEAANMVDAKLVSFSSDQVYTGCLGEGPYLESDSLPAPANRYARHKLEAEQRVLDISPDAVLLRATWMYDMPMYGHANRGNFLVNIIDAVLHGKELCFSSQEHRGITYVRQVVEHFDRVFDLPGGIYNYGSENSLNMLETAESLLNGLGVEYCVQDMECSRHNLWMDCSQIKQQGIYFDTTPDGLKRCLKDYGLAGNSI